MRAIRVVRNCEIAGHHLKRNKMPLDRSIRLISVVGVNGKVLASTDGRELAPMNRNTNILPRAGKAFIQAMCITGTTVEHRGILIILLSPQRPSLGGNRRSIGGGYQLLRHP